MAQASNDSDNTVIVVRRPGIDRPVLVGAWLVVVDAALNAAEACSAARACFEKKYASDSENPPMHFSCCF